ncbi:hypothetical protein DFQ27_008880 [Actinomortierella ambigua]|uniref:Uncharacterized protein n=1 Tax=Actinomortierella ambigua TaxID=1343610 RepID=A0A9P6QHK2_9FUNG|nr:hypothetical protein DFQ27_008880 [Actinomortierella ambigua]
MLLRFPTVAPTTAAATLLNADWAKDGVDGWNEGDEDEDEDGNIEEGLDDDNGGGGDEKDDEDDDNNEDEDIKDVVIVIGGDPTTSLDENGEEGKVSELDRPLAAAAGKLKPMDEEGDGDEAEKSVGDEGKDTGKDDWMKSGRGGASSGSSGWKSAGG